MKSLFRFRFDFYEMTNFTKGLENEIRWSSAAESAQTKAKGREKIEIFRKPLQLMPDTKFCWDKIKFDLTSEVTLIDLLAYMWKLSGSALEGEIAYSLQWIHHKACEVSNVMYVT